MIYLSFLSAKSNESVKTILVIFNVEAINKQEKLQASLLDCGIGRLGRFRSI